MNKNTNTKREETQDLVPMPDQAEALIGKAIDKGVSVETMEKLLAMRRELHTEWAKRRFDEAMAAFQAECPVIEKTKTVDFVSKRTGQRTAYRYAPLDEIVRQVKEKITGYGFSYTIETEHRDREIVSIVTVQHVDGYAKTSRFAVPIDSEAFMNAQQQYAAASTFGKRYAFCNAFGILTGDEDTDAADVPEVGKAPEEGEPERAGRDGYQTALATPPQIHFIEKLCGQKGVTHEELCEQLSVDKLSKLTLSQASAVIDALKERPDADRDRGNGYRHAH
jgi:hypothetical protein